jgi:hypothetical protein
MMFTYTVIASKAKQSLIIVTNRSMNKDHFVAALLVMTFVVNVIRSVAKSLVICYDVYLHCHCEQSEAISDHCDYSFNE